MGIILDENTSNNVNDVCMRYMDEYARTEESRKRQDEISAECEGFMHTLTAEGQKEWFIKILDMINKDNADQVYHAYHSANKDLAARIALML